MSLTALMSPQTVAVIGASRSPGKVGHAVLGNLISDGFAGDIVPVNPFADEILGRRCYERIGDYPGKIDLAVIVVPRLDVKAAVQSALDKDVGAIAIITAGFKETGPEGAALEREIAVMCRARNVPMLGPNSVGIINTHHHMNAAFAAHMPSTGGVSVLSQSGALCASLLDLAAGRQLGLAKLISIGNQADLTETELLAALGEDEQTAVIVGYLESIVSGEAFVRTAASVGERKPVILMKLGLTPAGAEAIQTHTGSIAGGDIAYAAAFRRAGVIRAETFDSLVDYTVAFAMQPLPKGKRVAIVTNGGGPGVMAADAVGKHGLELAALSATTLAFLAEHLPGMASANNPVDILEDAGHNLLGLAVGAVSADPAVDATIVLLKPVAVIDMEAAATAIATNADSQKPILASFVGGDGVRPGRQRLRSLGVPDFPSPERAVAALDAMSDYVAWRERPPRVVARFPVNRRRVERIVARNLRTGRSAVGIVKAKEILSAYDFAVLPGEVAANAEEAVDLASSFGFPVVLKIMSRDIVHKSDVGGVKLGLASREMVADAYELMMVRVKREAPQARVDGVYVERMADPGTEAIIGMTRDPQFGPMLMFGLGGVFVEVLRDVAFHLAPITADEAVEMLMGTRSHAHLVGGRLDREVLVTSIAGCLQRVSQMATDFDAIAELDINPLIVGPAGTEPVVVDARIVLGLSGGGS